MTRIDSLLAVARELAEAMYPEHPDPLNMPSIKCYQHGTDIEREVILRRWRQENRENRDLLAAGMASWFSLWPDTHEEFLEIIGKRQRNLARAQFIKICGDDYIEPRGFNDKTDSWDAKYGGPTGTMGPEEWGR